MTQVLEISSETQFQGHAGLQWKRIQHRCQRKLEKQDTCRGLILCWTERSKSEPDLLDYVRGILFGSSNGETLASYWKKHNTDYATVDMRFGVKATKEVAFQFMINNLLNKEYSYRPMAVGAPRTFVVKMDVTF